MKHTVLRSILLLPTLALVTALAGCGGAPDPDPVTTSDSDGSTPEVVATRDLAAALFAEEKYQRALEVMQPLATASAPTLFDLNAIGICAYALGDLAGARSWFERALELDPEAPAPHFNLGKLALDDDWDIDAALGHFEVAHAAAPDDLPTSLSLANVYFELDRLEDAERQLAELRRVGLEFSGSWYMTIVYRSRTVQSALGNEARADELSDEFDQLFARDVTVPSDQDLRRGNFGRLLPPVPLATDATPALALPELGLARPLLEGALGEDFPVAGLALAGHRQYWQLGEEVRDPGAAQARRLPDTIGLPDWVAWGPAGVRLLSSAGQATELSATPTERALPLDLDDDGDLDLVTVSGTRLELFLQADGSFTRSTVAELPTAPRDAALWDYDHEGDLDLVLVGEFGLLVLRNDGADVPGGGFTDATEEAGLAGLDVLDWLVVEDFDTDQDVDLLVGGAGGAHLADNLRAGLFRLEDERVAGLPIGRPPLVADLDHDGRPDLVFDGGRLFTARVDGSYKARADGPTGRGLAVIGDLDRNGDLDALAVGEDGRPAAWLGLAASAPLELPEFERFVALTDTDGDGADDLVVLRDGRAEVHPGTPGDGTGRSFRLVLEGVKDSRRGRGAIVELRIGTGYQRLYWREELVTVGLGANDEALVLRVTWPNGVVQNIANHPAGQDLVVRQKKGLVGSCPFLYSWNGTEYVFVSDVLGITPLGLPMAPGMFVPPDHDEYVLVTGEQLAAREVDGGLYYDLQFTEELREVTYLDEARLIVVDHPIGTEIFPDERFCFPPFPGGHTHITEAPLAPVSAREVDLSTGSASEGRDWAVELAAIDGTYAAPFEHFEGRFQGLAKPHVVELAFDPAVVADAEQLRLFLTGWFFWTDASVNMAAARTPGVDFVPPIFSVPDPEAPGGWRELGPPFGFPAGKTKTMVADLTGALDPADPRVRIFSTLRLYWDSIRLGIDNDDAPMVTTELRPHSAELWERGFSRPVAIHQDRDLEWFDWSELEAQPRWNQHPGRYTRFGDVTPLLDAPEDQFVILGAGDALHLRFDAAGVPELAPGHRRDYLVFLDGWAKDRDPNAIEVEFVEPLPFHGMSGFPYGPAYGTDEAFPDTPELRAWAAEWNTREARRWIEPLATRR